jgi:uncharacterized membrane protein
MKLERKEILYIIYIIALISTIFLLAFTVNKYIACAKTMTFYNTSICTGCKALTDLGIIQG